MKTITFLFLIPCLIAFLLTFGSAGFARPGGLGSDEMKQLVSLRQAGLGGNQAQIGVIRQIIKKPFATDTHAFTPSLNEILVITALRSATRLHDVSALADIDTLRQRTKQHFPGVSNFAAVQEARLKADQATDSLPNLSAQVNAFYNALGLSPREIMAGIENYKKRYYASPEGRRLPIPVEVYALREVADMAYQSQSPAAVSLLNTSPLDFSQDFPSALKMRLAPLSYEVRITALLEALVSTRILATNEEYEMQLLADEGQPAGRAIALRLQDALKHRAQYQQVNIQALFRVLTAIGDPAQAPIVAQFLHDPDIAIRQDAETLSANLPSGTASVFPRAVGY